MKLLPRNADHNDYDNAYGTWEIDNSQTPLISTYRLSWRKMAATTGYRTIYPSLIPPGSAHIDGVISAGPILNHRQLIAGVFASSILIDFLFRSTGKANVHYSDFVNLSISEENCLWSLAARLYLRLNCLTIAYAPLWEEITGEQWTVDTPLRTALARQQAQNEIDAIVALSLGVSADELCMIYRTQFPVMRKYDQQDLFDAHGRKIPKEVLAQVGKLGETKELSTQARTWTHPQSDRTYCFEFPFTSLDREAELRKAFTKFSQEETFPE